ncbi:hypothetical protein PVAP13_2NG021500 [Panicum virgatum]|uniref:Uncharacterized protein n=1 Tax=Panicum virgatum TaxID=38727 RepID=A0A8T0VN12_PANVG|nr:hypothetical protein PVAP13_2NG021500 [Panicum virgatum]
MDACARVWKRRKVHSGPAMAGPELERKKGRQLATDRDTEYDDDRTHVVCLPNTWRSKRNGSRDRATREEGKCAVGLISQVAHTDSAGLICCSLARL